MCVNCPSSAILGVFSPISQNPKSKANHICFGIQEKKSLNFDEKELDKKLEELFDEIDQKIDIKPMMEDIEPLEKKGKTNLLKKFRIKKFCLRSKSF